MENLPNNQFKICTKCKCEKSLDEFYFRKDIEKYYNKCKKCYIKLSKQYSEENKEKISQYQKEYMAKNKEKISNAIKEYNNKNKEELIKKRRKYYEENKEVILSKNKEYREKNKEKIARKEKEHYNANKIRIKLQNKKYRQTEKGRIVFQNTLHKRRAIKNGGDVTSEQLLHLKKTQTHCYWCGCNLKKIKSHIDHYIPISKGGRHTISNLVMACPTCNTSKKDKLPEEFAISIGKLL